MEHGRGKLKIPVDSDVATYVPYRGGQGSFRYISVTDVLHDRVDHAQLKDKIVLLGTTAPGLMDMRSTPVSEVFPGVEVHANMISGILDQNLKGKPAYMLGAEVTWLLLIGITLGFLLPVLSPAKAIIASAGRAYCHDRSQPDQLALRQHADANGEQPGDDRAAVRIEHVLRILGRVANQAADYRPVREICAFRAGGRDEQEPRASGIDGR